MDFDYEYDPLDAIEKRANEQEQSLYDQEYRSQQSSQYGGGLGPSVVSLSPSLVAEM